MTPIRPEDTASVVAAVLCMLEGPDAPLEHALKGFAPTATLSLLRDRLCKGERVHRARHMAAIITQVTVQFNSWRLL